MLQAVIFDFDGLILNTEWPHFEVWRDIYAQRGYTLLLEQYTQCVGADHSHFDPFGNLEELTGQTLSKDEIDAIRLPRLREAVAALEVMPGVRERIAEAQDIGLKLAVASSSDHGWVDGHLKRLGLWDHFQAVVARDDVAQVKPAPDLFLLAAARLDVEPSGCVVFEDSHNGIVAAKRAEMLAIAVPNRVTEVSDFSMADAVLTSLDDITLADLNDQAMKLATASANK